MLKFWFYFACQTAGATILFWKGVPFYRKFLAGIPYDGEVFTIWTILILVLIQPAFWLADGLHIRDADLAVAIRRALVLAAGVSHGDVVSTVSRGRVVLDGLVDDAQTRVRAARAVAAVPGVTTVVNHIRVPCPSDGPDDYTHA